MFGYMGTRPFSQDPEWVQFRVTVWRIPVSLEGVFWWHG
jgi:hypothetical protein